jgi:predicted RNA binding protein YcfA (HicA-like mRNA interferase family)
MMPGKKERISVPVHGSSDLKIGLLRAIMKLAEIEDSEL